MWADLRVFVFVFVSVSGFVFVFEGAEAIRVGVFGGNSLGESSITGTCPDSTTIAWMLSQLLGRR